jgi:predicted ATPase
MRLDSLLLTGYRAFREFRASLGPLEVLVGANGSGKTTLFEFLRFLRDSMAQDIPPEIVAGSGGQQIFHKQERSALDTLTWSLELNRGESKFSARYLGQVMGPIGRPSVLLEQVQVLKSKSEILLDIARPGVAKIREDEAAELFLELRKPNRLVLSLVTNPAFKTLYAIREYIESWRFYSSFHISTEKVRQPVVVEQNPFLQEDAGNLSSVLHYLYTEHGNLFTELEQHLRATVPGFKALSVKARGGPGQVLAFWQEDGVEGELTLADLSDGILRLLCWIVLCVHPKPPGLICIDEPDQGVHPRTLPLLAGLFEKASERTQILLATHASYFLLQFGIEQIAVLRKENGEVKFFKPKDSEALTRNLEDFGSQEIEVMHRSDELEQLA